jgi:hypothetical protein
MVLLVLSVALFGLGAFLIIVTAINWGDAASTTLWLAVGGMLAAALGLCVAATAGLLYTYYRSKGGRRLTLPQEIFLYGSGAVVIVSALWLLLI